MIKIARFFLIFCMLISFLISLGVFLWSPKVRTPRVLIYQHLVEKKKSGVKVGLPRRGIESPLAVQEYLSILFSRPPVVLFRPYFDGKVELDNVQRKERTLYVSLKSLDASAMLNKEELVLARKAIRRNFPIYRNILFFLDGVPAG